ncbi:hypothetical protein FALBO_6519 [Fusarium albosuccineum]|uniref:Uncharacterized protein n=1 Tax=Fusarium albosuccineum TaxID=1237068 RepID=A0A8H4PK19_9HYPO|nr:hypothetical protein FALBO_6519 [Fusarium albosuccineum]
MKGIVQDFEPTTPRKVPRQGLQRSALAGRHGVVSAASLPQLEGLQRPQSRQSGPSSSAPAVLSRGCPSDSTASWEGKVRAEAAAAISSGWARPAAARPARSAALQRQASVEEPVNVQRRPTAETHDVRCGG